MAPPRNPNVLLRMFTTGQLANQLLARELEPVGFSPNQFAVTSVIGPFVVNEAFGDLWVPNFGGRDVWRVRAR